ncbi:M48 family metallopeptidase, partial [bacterium]|nr:M48 family metallopeptidase [bacterium]
FALPGGFIYCTNSLLQLCQLNKDEIAFVLAHEIAHVVKMHPFKRVLATSSLHILSNLGRTSSILNNITKQAIQKALQSGYSQDQESEADRFAVRMMMVAGFDPNRAIRFLEKLKGTTSEKVSISNYFSSHPAFNERIRIVKEVIKQKSQ